MNLRSQALQKGSMTGAMKVKPYPNVPSGNVQTSRKDAGRRRRTSMYPQLTFYLTQCIPYLSIPLFTHLFISCFMCPQSTLSLNTLAGSSLTRVQHLFTNHIPCGASKCGTDRCGVPWLTECKSHSLSGQPRLE